MNCFKILPETEGKGGREIPSSFLAHVLFPYKSVKSFLQNGKLGLLIQAFAL